MSTRLQRTALIIAVLAVLIAAVLSSAQSVSTECEVANCEICPIANVKQCISCVSGYLLTKRGTCLQGGNGVAAAPTALWTTAFPLVALAGQYFV